MGRQDAPGELIQASLSPRDIAFRDESRAFLAARLTTELREVGRRMTSVFVDRDDNLARQAILHQRGRAAPDWPMDQPVRELIL